MIHFVVAVVVGGAVVAVAVAAVVAAAVVAAAVAVVGSGLTPLARSARLNSWILSYLEVATVGFLLVVVVVVDVLLLLLWLLELVQL